MLMIFCIKLEEATPIKFLSYLLRWLSRNLAPIWRRKHKKSFGAAQKLQKNVNYSVDGG